MKVILMTLVLMLSACQVEYSTTKADDTKLTEYDLPGMDNVHEFYLKDGTRCVAAHHSGLACQWKSLEPLEEVSK